jgi:hypothetical protein
MNRIFVSYRTSDAKKDAHRLAVDLERIFGDDQVFFDKHDLRGGAAWRDSIGQALGERPIVLVLMTPDLVGAAHPEGGRRIDRDDDPIRGELVAAQRHGALVVPLLTEGMTMPGRALLPADLHFMAEAHALKLRTDDWAHDLGRLVNDLDRQGVKRPASAPVLPAAAPAGGLGGVWVVLGVALLLWLLVVAGAENEGTPEAYLGAAVMILVPLGMFVYAFRRLRRVHNAAQWAALVLAVLSVVLLLYYVGEGGGTGDEAQGRYRPPVTSTIAPVV